MCGQKMANDSAGRGSALAGVVGGSLAVPMMTDRAYRELAVGR